VSIKKTLKRQPVRGNTDFEYDLAIKQNNLPKLGILKKRRVLPPKGALHHAYYLGHKELIEPLIQAGADLNYIGYGGVAIMGDCILKSDVCILKLLLQRGANPNKGYGGLPAIILAARVGNLEVLQMLVNAGASLFANPLVGREALMEAVGRGHAEIVRYLLDQGVSCRVKKPWGKTAKQYAIEKGNPEVLAAFGRTRHVRQRS
jgi:ankyrin repeat protein